MPSPTCPKCHRVGRHLIASSENSVVDYYRCDSCGHVWTLDRQGVRRDVMIVVPKRVNHQKHRVG